MSGSRGSVGVAAVQARLACADNGLGRVSAGGQTDGPEVQAGGCMCRHGKEI